MLAGQVAPRRPAGAPLYTAYATPALVVAARAAKADGVLDKGASVQTLAAAIRTLAAGETVLPMVSRTEFEGVIERVADEDLRTFALLLEDVDPADIAEAPVLRVLDQIRPRLERA